MLHFQRSSTPASCRRDRSDVRHRSQQNPALDPARCATVGTWSEGAAAGSDVLGRYSASLVTQHVIRQAVAVARLIGIPAPVHVRQVERPDGPQRTARREEFAD